MHPLGARRSGRLAAFGSVAALSATLAVTGIAIWSGYLGRGSDEARPAPDARFVGSAACANCHGPETAEWQRSQHRAAMADADERTVLGDFRDVAMTYAGTRSVFRRSGNRFVVHTDGPDGKPKDFDIRYTFGVYPLQQYLIATDSGRLQALSIAWDARPKSVGGQRWFHLYPSERVTHDDELHWTRPAQNWNFMCADCHSTGVRKNYDAATERYETRWSEISVGCEACHGPGSRHVAWAGLRDRGKASRDSTKGLSATLRERRGVTWSAAGGKPRRSQPRASDHEIQVCAQCHSRRSQLADGYEAGKPLLDYYLPALLTRPLYDADGRQRAEVYNWGSFLQSKMNAHGVTCSDCHDPHSGKLRKMQTINATCTTCHVAARYDTTAHPHGAPARKGASCASCHMPTTTYMQIDQRHDHFIRVPGGPRFPSVIARATTLAELEPHTNADVAALGAGLNDPGPIVRLGALQATALLPTEARAALVSPLLSDSLRALRIEAAGQLADVPTIGLPPDRRVAFERAAAEFIAAQRYNADRPESRVNLGTFFAARGDFGAAGPEFEAALRVDRKFVAAYVNLADMYRMQGREADAEQVLRDGIAACRATGALHYALGLTLAREKRLDDAVAELRRAAAMEPSNKRFASGYAAALAEQRSSNGATLSGRAKSPKK